VEGGHPHLTFKVLVDMKWSPIDIMPRKKRKLGDYESVDLEGHILEPIPRDLSPELSEPNFYNICPCTKCAFLPKPSVRKMSTIQCHLKMHRMAEGGVHEINLTYIPFSPISHSMSHARSGWLVLGLAQGFQYT
jgi:hypothetical protein